MKLNNFKSKVDHFADIIGYQNLKNELERIIDVINNKDKYEKLGGKITKNILLDGAPGTGKTTIANDFIKAINRKTYVIRKDKPNGEFVNSIKETFEEAKKNQPSIILLDDMDKFANGDAEHINCEEYVTIQSSIDNVKGTDVFIFATTNSLSLLPRSLTRSGRFDKKFSVKLPFGKEREEIIKHYLRDKKIDENIDFEIILKLFSYFNTPEIEAVINNASIEAGFRKSEKISVEDIVSASLKQIYGADLNTNFDDYKEVEKIASHEAGHTLAASILCPENLVYTSIYPGEGKTGGRTGYVSGTQITTKEELFNKIVISFAGKVAYEDTFGDIDIGTNGDIHDAYRDAETIVDDISAYGFDKFERPKNSNELFVRREQAIYMEMDKALNEARKLIVENREYLKELTKRLLEDKVLLYTEILEIKEKINNAKYLTEMYGDDEPDEDY